MGRIWSDGPGGLTPLAAARLNAMEADITNALGVPDAALAARINDTTPSQARAALNGAFEQRADRSGITAQALPVWVKKRALTELNQSPMRILCIGDSTTAGVYSDSYTSATGSTNQGGPNSWPAQLVKRLQAAGLPADYAFCLPGHGGNADSRWNINTWGYAAYGAGMNGVATAASAGLTSTVTPTNVANTYVIYYYGDSGTGTFTAQATGGTLATINTNQATPGFYSYTITASASASTNTITLTNSSGTVFVGGIEAYDSTAPNKIRVMGAGVGGSKATDWNNNGNPGALNFIKGIAPDLTVISLGVNDGAVPDTTANVLAAVNGISAAAAASGDVLLMSAVPHNSVTAVDGYNAAYLGTGKPYVDLQRRWGNSAQSWGLITSDNTHPNALGYADMATAVSLALLSI